MQMESETDTASDSEGTRSDDRFGCEEGALCYLKLCRVGLGLMRAAGWGGWHLMGLVWIQYFVV